MLSVSRARLLIGLAILAVALLPASSAQGQEKKDNSKSVSFETGDGMKISGTFWPSPGGKKDAVVMLLHGFDLKKGGSSQQEGWSRLAKSLQDEGYSVLGFDFRGFGDSKAVNTEKFWSPTYRHNNEMIRGAPRKPETIDHTKFLPSYLPYLINDIAAAKAYLDRRNDAGQLNSGNLIVIGAGEGAALGALWLKNECRRRRDTMMPPVLLAGAAQLAQPEINDVAGCVWLSIRPSFNNRVNNTTQGALMEAGVTNKVPMAFMFGAQDSTSKSVSERLARAVKGTRAKGLVTSHGVSGTKLAGNMLLDKETIDWIMKDCLDKILDSRGGREQKDRKSEASAYWYTFPGAAKRNFAWKISKNPGQEAPLVDVDGVVFQIGN